MITERRPAQTKKRKPSKAASRPKRNPARASPHRFSKAFRASPVAMAISRLADGRILDANKMFLRLVGYERDEVIGRSSLDLVLWAHPQDRSRLTLALEAGTPVHNVPTTLRTKTGDTRAAFVSAELFELGGQSCIIALIQDDADRTHNVNALRETQELLERMFSAMDLMVAYMDRDFNFIRVNRAYAEADGREPPFYVGKNHFDLFPNAENQAIFRRVVETGEPYAVLAKPFVYIEHPERGVTYWDWNLQPIKATEGPVTGVVLSLVNVTERVRAEEAIRQLNAELERRVTDRTAELQAEIAEHQRAEVRIRLQVTALESAGNGVVITDRNGTIEWVNPAFTQLTGYTREEAIGQNPRILKSGRQDPSVYRELWARILSGKTWRGEITNRRKDGGLYVEEMTVTPVRQPNGEISHFVAIKQDVTQRRQAEERIRQLNRDLERRATELEAANQELDAFVYSVSHDLRAPLASIEGFARLVLEEPGGQLSIESQRFLKLIRENTSAMNRLIEGLLTLSRASRQPLRKEAVDPAGLVQEALAELRGARIGREVEISVGALPTCQADRVLLRQVYVNLLSNALKFTRACPVTQIEIGASTEGGETIFWIKDNGVGFDVGQAERLFGAFQRLHSEEEYEGIGVGLAIVERIIRRHGGRVWAEASAGQGAAFYFALP